jgi:hypothetical protein
MALTSRTSPGPARATSGTGTAASLAFLLPDPPTARSADTAAVTTAPSARPNLSASELLLDDLPDALEILGICEVTGNRSLPDPVPALLLRQ